MGPELNVRYNVGAPAHESVAASKQDKSRLQIAGIKNSEVVLAKGINIIENKAKATLYNAVGHVWTKIKNKFSSESAQVMPRRKYVPLSITDVKGNQKLVYVNVNSLMKHLLGTKGADREAKLKELEKVYGYVFESVKGTSTESMAEQGEHVKNLLELMVQNNVKAAERRKNVEALVTRPITSPMAQAIRLDIYKPPLNYVPSSHFGSETYRNLCKARMGLSGTATGQTGETDRSRMNWEATDKLVAQWAMNRDQPFTLDRILEINKGLCEGLKNNGGQPGALRRPGQEIRAGAHAYIGGAHVQEEMEKFMKWLNAGLQKCDEGKGSPVLLAAQAYQRLVSIHPFSDGNGRTTRMVMDYILQRYGLPPAALKESNVAVFGGKDEASNIDCDSAVRIIKTGIEESCKHLGIESPFTSGSIGVLV